MSLRGVFLLVGVLAAFLAIFVPLARRVKGGTDDSIDSERLRRTFVALSLYESTHDGMPAPNLQAVMRDLDPTDLQSVDDPQVGGAGPFSLDAALPDFPLHSKTRVSWTYRWHWPNAGDPRSVELDSRRGLLADWWTGSLLRVDANGAIVKAPRKDPLTFGDLFGK